MNDSALDEISPGVYYDNSTGFTYDTGGSGGTGFGNTGSGSPSFLDYLNFAGKTSTGLLGALKGSRAAAAPTPTTTNWGLIAGIGAAVVLVLVLVMSLGRR
jgi:hypothetical protein